MPCCSYCSSTPTSRSAPNRAATDFLHGRLLLYVTGQPSLSLAGPDSRLSGNATAGKDRIFPLTLHNTGTASARAVKLDASAPSG